MGSAATQNRPTVAREQPLVGFSDADGNQDGTVGALGPIRFGPRGRPHGGTSNTVIPQSDEQVQQRNPLSLSARQRRSAQAARDDARGLTHFLAVVVGSCCVAGVAFALAVRFMRGDTPPATRTAEEWITLLRAPRPGVRADAVHDLSELDSVPAIPCGLLAARLTDAAAVRVEAVALLANVAARGRCIDDLIDVLAHANDSRARVAAAQVLGASSAVAARFAVPTLVGALTDPALQDAAVVALGRMGDTSDSVQRALEHVGESARGETLGDALAALVALRATGELLRPIIRRALSDSLGNVRAAALVDLELISATAGQRAVAMRTAIGMLRDPDASVREAAARLVEVLHQRQSELQQLIPNHPRSNPAHVDALSIRHQDGICAAGHRRDGRDARDGRQRPT
jgi:hypothetical protein